MPSMPRLTRTVPAALLAGLLWSNPSWAADADRGRALYELRCGNCHSESVHGRKARVAKDFNDVRAWVVRWTANLKLAWTQEEIDDVALYLNGTYYRYPCPPQVCKVISQAPAAPPSAASRYR